MTSISGIGLDDSHISHGGFMETETSGIFDKDMPS